MCGDHGSSPRSEVLGAALVTQHVLDVGVDVLCTEVSPAARFLVRKQSVAATSPSDQTFEQPGHPLVTHSDIDLLAGFRFVEEGDAMAVQLDVALLDCGDPETAVLIHVSTGADPEDAKVQQRERRRSHRFARRQAGWCKSRGALKTSP